jgi:LysR family transcriptional regulator, low CO2-responsive transcriptional regulator
MGLTQSAVSVQVRELGALLGAPLFDVLGKRVHLTDAGRLLEEHAARAEGLLREISQDFSALREIGAGAVRIGASTSVGIYYLPPLLAEFSAKHPRVAVTLEIENTAHIEEKLLRNEFDLGFMGARAASADLVSEPFLEDEIFFACAPGHPLARVATVTPERLTRERLIVREVGSATRATMEAHLLKRGVIFRDTMSFGSVEAIKQVVMSGLGVAYFSTLTVCNEIAAGWLAKIRVRGLAASRTFFIVRHRSKKDTPALGALTAFARAWQPRAD